MKSRKCRGCKERRLVSEFETQHGRCGECRAERPKLCTVCMASFLTNDAQKVYCSRSCAERAQRLKRRHRGRERNYPRERWQAEESGLSFREWARARCPLPALAEQAAKRGLPSGVQIIRKPTWRRWPGMSQAQWLERTAHSGRIRKRAEWRLKYAGVPEFRLREIVRAQAKKHRRFGCLNTRIRDSLFYPGRNADVFKMLGYTPEDLRVHLERQFVRGMDWAKFAGGEIHIDHVRPLKSFDLDDPEQVIEAWSLPNLQPLWAKDNASKAARMEKLL